MKPKLFALLEHRFREMFHAKPDIEMDEAIEAGDAQCIDRLAEAMGYVLTELQTQERENG